MGQKTGIAWCDHTFNAWMGCMRVSPACLHCYAEAFVSKRMGKEAWGGKPHILTTGPWREVQKWNAAAEADGVRRRVFCASLADVFERNDGPVVSWQGRRLLTDGVEIKEAGPGRRAKSWRPLTLDDIRERLWKVIRQCPWLDFLLLTKRPENIAAMLPKDLQGAANVWLGTTVESSDYLHRIDALLAVPAVVHFVSVESQLEEINLTPYLDPARVNWVITGGESKQGKAHVPRPYDLAGPLSIVRQCRAAGVAAFVKQLGSRPVVTLKGLGVPIGAFDPGHSKGDDPWVWPKKLRVLDFPRHLRTSATLRPSVKQSDLRTRQRPQVTSLPPVKRGM